MDLSKKKCVPCEGGVEKLDKQGIDKLLSHLTKAWELVDEMKIVKAFHFKDFSETMRFVNHAAEIAEEEGHHPVMHVYYSKCEVEIWTHAILGLSENDFILAEKYNRISS